ncbi:MAG: hypothetical protein AAB250_00085, partial [Bdellovibrionota bacterium]
MKFIILLARFVQSLFGRLSYSYAPPEWVSRLASRLSKSPLGAATSRCREWIRANPKRARLSALGTVATVAVVWGGTVWYLRYLDSLPKPNYVTVSLTTPREPD